MSTGLGTGTSTELRDGILSLAAEYPRACAHALKKLLASREGTRNLALVLESIGFIYARQLFDSIGPAQWRAMEQFVAEEGARSPGGAAARALGEVHQRVLAECLSWGPLLAGADPFAFMLEEGDTKFSWVLERQDPSDIALLSAFRTQQEMAVVVAALPEGVRHQTVLCILRLERLPAGTVGHLAARFAARLHASIERGDYIRSDEKLETASSAAIRDPIETGVASLFRAIELRRRREEAGILKFVSAESPQLHHRLQDALAIPRVVSDPSQVRPTHSKN